MLTDRFEQALLYAARLHREQKRKGSQVPYLAHLLAVTALILEAGGDEDQAIAGLLHDAVEDQGGLKTLTHIREQFGERVARIVDGCSDSDTLPKPPWRQRKEQYLEHLRTAAPEVLLVSLADKVHNARSIREDYQTLGEPIWERFTGGKAGSLWYYHSLAAIFQQVYPCPLADELSIEVELLDRIVRK
ncbi:MAG: HD domain-containing protein [Anaerolineales bacterium]|nr:HD domain-containing protein [Anaerolineales bacterium]